MGEATELKLLFKPGRSAQETTYKHILIKYCMQSKMGLEEYKYFQLQSTPSKSHKTQHKWTN